MVWCRRCDQKRNRHGTGLGRGKCTINANIQTHTVTAKLNNSCFARVSLGLITTTIAKNDVAIPLLIHLNSAFFGSNDGFFPPIAFSHKDISDLISGFLGGLDEEDAFAAHSFNKASRRNSIHILTCRYAVAQPIGFCPSPRRNNNREQCNNNNDRKRKLNCRFNPRQNRTASGRKPDNHFIVLPRTHQGHQRRNEERSCKQRRQIH